MQNRAEIEGKIEKNGARGKNRQKCLPRRPFFRKKSIFGDFRAPAWSHFGPKSAKKAEGGQHFWVIKTRADDGSVPRALPEASRSHSGGSEDPPEAIFERIFDDF